MQENIKTQNIVDGYVEDMTIYAITVNRKQNVPDTKDGLKSVERRILYALFADEHLRYNEPYDKCAGVVGTTLKKYHPHGDSTVYDTLVGMATPWDRKYPLVDGSGNFGNILGAGAAHYRYTECRLSKYGQECIISELAESKDVIDWDSNFNDKYPEPRYLPAAVPNILINGVLGLGVGLVSAVPRHNLGEVIDATIALIKNPDAKVVLIPDHCMPVEIIDTNWKEICNSGTGKYRARGITEIETEGDVSRIIIRSIPDRTSLQTKDDKGIADVISDMVKEGKLPQVKKMYDESSDLDMRYIIELKKGSDPNYVRDFIYKRTALEKAYTINFALIDGIEPVSHSYKSYLLGFIAFRKMIKFRTYSSLYANLNTELIKKNLYIRLMRTGEIDEITAKIRKMKKVDKDDRIKFMEDLIKKYNVSDLEVDFIMTMDTMKLAPGYLPIYEKEAADLTKELEVYYSKIIDDSFLNQEIIDDLLDIKARYNMPVLRRVIKGTDGADAPAGEFRIVITEGNYIKKISVNDNINSYKGDNPKYTLVADNREFILLFDKKGKVFKQPVWKIPLCDKNSAGTDIRVLIKNCTSDIIKVMYDPMVVDMSKQVSTHYLVVVTEKNCIKKLTLDEFVNVNASGTTYTKLMDGDSVIDVAILPNNMDIILYSAHKALRLKMKDIPHYKRSAIGVAAMNTPGTIDGISVVFPEVTHVLVITRNGKVNKFPIEGLPLSSRNKAGSSVIKLSKGDDIIAIFGVNDQMTVKITSATTTRQVAVSEIQSASSVSSGTSVSKEQLIKATIIL